MILLNRRSLIAIFATAVAVAVSGAAPGVLAQGYPQRPVKIVAGFAPGGSTDLGGRIIAQWLTDRLGRQFVIENRPGAASHIAAETVARAPPDGHTLLIASSADTINATLYPKAGFSFLSEIAAVGGLTQQPQVLLVNPAVPVQSFTELIAHLKAKPGALNIASAGNGSISHLAGELLRLSAGVEFVHLPYRGAGPALTDLLAGHVQMSFAGMAGSIQHAKSGRLRAVAVTTGKRSESLPDVAAIGEILPGYEAVSLFGIGAPKSTPPEIIEILNREINAGLADPKIQARYADLGGVVMPGPPQAFAKLLADETEKWARVIKAANIRGE